MLYKVSTSVQKLMKTNIMWPINVFFVNIIFKDSHFIQKIFLNPKFSSNIPIKLTNQKNGHDIPIALNFYVQLNNTKKNPVYLINPHNQMLLTERYFFGCIKKLIRNKNLDRFYCHIDLVPRQGWGKKFHHQNFPIIIKSMNYWTGKLSPFHYYTKNYSRNLIRPWGH